MKRIVAILLFISGIVLAIIIFNRNILARFIIIHGVKKTCGLGISIGKIDIRLPQVAIMGLKVYNPAGFKERQLANLPEISADFDFPAFFKNKVHLRKLKLEIRELDVIVNEQGRLNVNSLSLLVPKRSTGKAPEVKIDELGIKIDKISYKGYFPGVGVKEQEFDAGIDETFHDVTDPSRVAAQLMQKILSRIGIENLANFKIPGAFQKVLQEAGATVEETLNKAKGSLEKLFPAKAGGQ